MLVEVDKELEDVFPRYFKSREEDLTKLDRAVEKKDFETMRQIGHKVSGNAAGYGLSHLGELAKELEMASHDRQFAKCSDLVQKMHRYLRDLTVKFV